MRRKGKRNRQKEDLKSWRRNYIIMQTSKGRTQRDIASLLKVGVGTVNRDLSWFRDKTKEEITNFIEKILEEHEKSMVGLNAVLKEACS
jgi:DNA-directed RNA polymerase specialized sigma24 family protein